AKRAAVGRKYQHQPQAIREVLWRAGSRAHARGDRALREKRGQPGGPARLHGEAQAALRGEMKLKIEAIRARAVAAPMKRPLATSTGSISVAPLLLIDLHTDAGAIGRSYLWTPGEQHLAPLAKLLEA